MIEQQRKEQIEREAAKLEMEESALEKQHISSGLSAMLNLNNNKSNAPAMSKALLPPIPNAKVETVSENLKAHSLSPLEFTEYCKKKFHFKTIRVMRFKS